MILTGSSKKCITPDITGVTMMGWGQFSNKSYGIGMNIYSRAFIFYNTKDNKKIVFVCAEIAFITIAVKQRVIEYLHNKKLFEFTEENVMISATHTHSAPGGYSHYMMYNLNSYGFVKEVFDTYVEGIAESIIEANNNLIESSLYYSFDEISENIAFNRSIEAYNSNKDIEKIDEIESYKAIDRNMYLLEIRNNDNNLLSSINWFSVHCTNIHSDNYLIHGDNKGIASIKLENELNVLSAFAQSSCGDVTPNNKTYKNIPFKRGEYEDDYLSAEYNGNIQFKVAKKIINSDLNKKLKLSEDFDYIFKYVDFSNVIIDKEFSNGNDCKTSSGSIGVSMIAGTKEGPGISEGLKKILDKVSLVLNKKYYYSLSEDEKINFRDKIKSQGNKIIFADLGERSILTFKDFKNIPIPDSFDEMIKILKDMDKTNSIGDKPFTPNILPIQIFIIGELAIIGVPAEFTTIAGKRLKESVLNILSKRGVKEIVLSCYSNGYAGYVTTFEEYQIQLYEGGSTHFGQWTLSAYQTEFKKLSMELCKPKNERIKSNLFPHKFSEEEILKRSFK